ncbi:MAG: hypothetical protein GF392_02135 [Candidatus Omnitrophica bacterium]|nr:hypothetical protein [Candidatus Omnitrophota bacterium]
MRIRGNGYDSGSGRGIFVCFFITAVSLLVLFIPFINSAGASQRGGSYTTSSPRGDEEWSREIDAKLDTAIAVLKVIKEEVREPLPAAGSHAGTYSTTGEGNEADLDRIKAVSRRALGIWRELMAALGKAGEAETGEKEMKESVSDVARDLRGKLDSAIKAMSAAREDLEDIARENKDK